MTVATQKAKVTATGNGSDRTFSYSPLVIYSTSDLEVVVVVIATGVETVISRGSSSTTYSINQTVFPGTGSIQYPASGGALLASTQKIIIRRVLTIEQLTKLTSDAYDPEVQETALDKIAMILLQQQEELDRAVKFPVSVDSSFDTEIDLSLTTASEVLKINSTADGIDTGTNVTVTGSFSLTTDAPLSDTGGSTPTLSIVASSASVPGSMTAAHYTKLENIETAADVTDTTNVLAAS